MCTRCGPFPSPNGDVCAGFSVTCVTFASHDFRDFRVDRPTIALPPSDSPYHLRWLIITWIKIGENADT
jgi:hypothetical protein